VFVTALMITTYVPWLSLAFLPDQLALQEQLSHPPPVTEVVEDHGTTEPTPGQACDDVPAEGEEMDAYMARCPDGSDTVVPGAAGAAQPCDDVPAEGEDMDVYMERCPDGADTVVAPPSGARVRPCGDLPDEDENMDVYMERCPEGSDTVMPSDTPAPAAAARPCGDVPDQGESMDDYMLRCPDPVEE
jgi:hypothetical protein